MYYEINEAAARRAKEMNSFSEYVEGSATAEYRRKVDAVVRLAEHQKKQVEQEYHDKIDHYVDLYARKLADNYNRGFEIDARCPSIMISGGSNFPVAKKQKQNEARDRNVREYIALEKVSEIIRGVGMGGISSDDKNAVTKLTAKLKALEEAQERMKAANKAIRLKDTAKGDEALRALGYTEQEITELRKPDFLGRVGYASYTLTNNNANIRRVKERIAELDKATEDREEQHEGYILRENTDINRVQIIFDGKPDEQTRTLLKQNGFRWSPSQGAWQRMLNDNGRYAAKRVIKEMEESNA